MAPELFSIGVALAFVTVGFGVVFVLERRARRRWLLLGEALGLRPERAPSFGVLPRLSGLVSGRTIAVWTFTRGSGKSKSTWTALSAESSRIDPTFELRLTPEGFVDAIQKAFGGEDIVVGDAAFDKAFRIRGNDPYRATRALDALTRDHLLGVAKAEYEVVGGQVSLVRRGRVDDPRKVGAALETVTRLAAAMESGAGRAR